jgi:hypothetical protein
MSLEIISDGCNEAGYEGKVMVKVTRIDDARSGVGEVRCPNLPNGVAMNYDLETNKNYPNTICRILRRPCPFLSTHAVFVPSISLEQNASDEKIETQGETTQAVGRKSPNSGQRKINDWQPL